MARIRSIKPEFWRSPSTAAASPWARLLYIAMWNWADDYGVGEWTPRELLGFAFPNDAAITGAEFQCLCTEVATCFDTVFYTVRGRRYYSIPAWDEHQKNERRAKGKYPTPDDPEAAPDQEFLTVAEMRGTSVSTHGKTPAGTGEQGNRGTGNREQGKALVEPIVKPNLTVLFDAAYAHWPKKVKRDAAFARFKTACEKQPAESLARTIAAFGDAYKTATTKQFTPALDAWLYQKRWTDDLPTAEDVQRRPTRGDQNLAFVTELHRQQQANQLGIES